MGPRNPTEFEKAGNGWDPIFDVFALKKLPLKTATMIISDHGAEENLRRGVFNGASYWKNHGAESRWTLDEKKEWARYVREVLLSTDR